MLKQNKDKPLSELIVELQQKYQEENDQSDLFQKLYQQQLEIESSTDSSNFLPALLSGSTGSQSSHSQEGVQKNIKKGRKAKNSVKCKQENQDDKKQLPEGADKKTLQMIRNRISAQNSRDRKKAYLSKLEGDYTKQSNQLQELTDQVNYLQSQLEEANKLNQQYQSQIQNLICLNCGGKHFGYDDEAPISVSKNKSLGKLGFSFMVLLAVLAFVTLNQEQQPQQLFQTREVENPQLRALNSSDQQYNIFEQVSQNRIKGMTDIMEYNSEYNYKFFDTTYRAILRTEDSFVNEMINFNKERAKLNSGKALAPLNYHQPKVDSLYCPNVYRYQNSTQHGIQVKYQDDQWIHLVIPKDTVNIFYRENDQSILLKEFSKEQESETIRQKFQEIWCQVKTVSDFYM